VADVTTDGTTLPPVPVTSLELLAFQGNRSQGNFLGGLEIIILDTAAENSIIDFYAMDARVNSIAAFATALMFDRLWVNTALTFYTPGNNGDYSIFAGFYYGLRGACSVS
jgi:hypothetical protein